MDLRLKMNKLSGYIDYSYWTEQDKEQVVFSEEVKMIGIPPKLCPKCCHSQEVHEDDSGCMFDKIDTNNNRTSHGIIGSVCSCLWGYEEDE